MLRSVEVAQVLRCDTDKSTIHYEYAEKMSAVHLCWASLIILGFRAITIPSMNYSLTCDVAVLHIMIDDDSSVSANGSVQRAGPVVPQSSPLKVSAPDKPTV